MTGAAMWLLVTLFFTAAALGTVIYFTQPMRAHKAARLVLAERTATVDRLLDFSQTIQGAGKPDQIFETLSHFLRTELGLAGMAILPSEAETVPAIQFRTCWPADLVNPGPLVEMDAALCPCLRQNLP